MTTQPGFTQFPGGFANGVSIRGVPVLNTNPARVFWVSSLIGSDVYRGTQQRPFKTLAKAITATASGKNDVIYVMPGHIETVIAAAGILMNTTNVKVIGLGDGEDRPQITFATVVGASLRITGAGCSLYNIIGIAGINALTGPIDLRAAGLYVDMEWRDASSSIAAVSPVVTTAASTGLQLNLIVKGAATTSSAAAGVTLVGGTNTRINLDYYGYVGVGATTAVIVTATTPTVDLYISGLVNGNGSQLFYDGATSSTWHAHIYDSYADIEVSGGDRFALGGTNWNDWRYYTVFADFSSATWNTVAAHRIATVTGQCKLKITPVTSAAATTGGVPTIVLGDTTTANSIIASANPATLFTAANLIWNNGTTPGTALASSAITADVAEGLVAITSNKNIGYTIGSAAMLTGGINFYVLWRPLTPSSSVTLTTAQAGGVL